MTEGGATAGLSSGALHSPKRIETRRRRGRGETELSGLCDSAFQNHVLSEWLNLGGTQITDAALSLLANLTELETLFLYNTNITDAGLKHLAALSRLRELNIRNTGVTDARIEELRSQLPWRDPSLPLFGPIIDHD